ncbi:hypothetical protein AB2C92_34410, partial [Pseudomonas aeruginosa]
HTIVARHAIDEKDRGDASPLPASAKPCQHHAMSRAPSLAVLPLLLVAAPAWAQQQDTQAWEQLNLVVPIAPKLRVTLEEIARTS